MLEYWHFICLVNWKNVCGNLQCQVPWQPISHSSHFTHQRKAGGGCPMTSSPPAGRWAPQGPSACILAHSYMTPCSLQNDPCLPSCSRTGERLDLHTSPIQNLQERKRTQKIRGKINYFSYVDKLTRQRQQTLACYIRKCRRWCLCVTH